VALKSGKSVSKQSCVEEDPGRRTTHLKPKHQEPASGSRPRGANKRGQRMKRRGWKPQPASGWTEAPCDKCSFTKEVFTPRGRLGRTYPHLCRECYRDLSVEGGAPDVREWTTAICDLCQVTRQVVVVTGNLSQTYRHLCFDCYHTAKLEGHTDSEL
jgi:hypothetical protein